MSPLRDQYSKSDLVQQYQQIYKPKNINDERREAQNKIRKSKQAICHKLSTLEPETHMSTNRILNMYAKIQASSRSSIRKKYLLERDSKLSMVNDDI